MKKFNLTLVFFLPIFLMENLQLLLLVFLNNPLIDQKSEMASLCEITKLTINESLIWT